MEKFDLFLALLMIAGMGVYSAYIAKYAVQFTAKDEYEIYDASANAVANFLLPPRADMLGQRATGAVNSTANLSSTLLSSLNISAPWSPTDPGRYLLPQAPDELDDFAAQMEIVHTLSDYWYTYGILQIVILSLLIFRLLVVASFQSRVSVITESLAMASEELLHILFVIVLVTLMFACQAHILFGHRFFRLSTLNDAVYWTAKVGGSYSLHV